MCRNITAAEITALKETSFNVRKHIIKMSGRGGCFMGASLSCADLIVYLYSKFLNINKNNLDDPARDYFFLSKGHDVPALYGTFAELGFIEKERLNNHLKTNDSIYWHPNTAVPGIEFHSGSLGHLLSVAAGVAYDCKSRGTDNRIVVLTGDGELNEGSNWEACMVASALQLDNLTVVVDRNEFQANIKTEKLIPLEPLDEKFESFGFAVGSIDGHSFTEMDSIFSQVPFETGKPSVVLAHTLRGKGLPSIEQKADRWFCNFTQKEIDELMEELEGKTKAKIESEALTVR